MVETNPTSFNDSELVAATVPVGDKLFFISDAERFELDLLRHFFTKTAALSELILTSINVAVTASAVAKIVPSSAVDNIFTLRALHPVNFHSASLGDAFAARLVFPTIKLFKYCA